MAITWQTLPPVENKMVSNKTNLSTFFYDSRQLISEVEVSSKLETAHTLDSLQILERRLSWDYASFSVLTERSNERVIIVQMQGF